MNTDHSGKSQRLRWALTGFLVIADFFLLTAHRAHLLGILTRRREMNPPPTYGLWTLVILNSVLFIAFAFSFFKPRTLLMFPVLLLMHVRLARREERAAVREFGASYTDYAAGAPAFFPCLSCQPRGNLTFRSVLPVHAAKLEEMAWASIHHERRRPCFDNC